MTDFKIEWRYPFDPNKQDALWFYGDRHMATATLTTDSGESYMLDIYCDGETEFHVPYIYEDGTWDRDDYRVIRHESDWEAVGVRTDADQYALQAAWLERGFDIHQANSWFDLYTSIDGYVEHLDAVTHTQEDAEAMALSILSEVAEHGGWLDWLRATA